LDLNFQKLFKPLQRVDVIKIIQVSAFFFTLSLSLTDLFWFPRNEQLTQLLTQIAMPLKMQKGSNNKSFLVAIKSFDILPRLDMSIGRYIST
jgi:hypothetical protein